jgi:ABC-2 type transport system permease protein
MFKLIATVHKELILLLRDKVGLSVLFFMPAALVIVMSIVQDSAWKSIKETDLEILFVNKDHSFLGDSIEDGLLSSEHFKVIKDIDGVALTEDKAREVVSNGDYQVCVVVAEGTTERAREKAGLVVGESLGANMPFLSLGGPAEAGTPGSEGDENDVFVYLDPAIRGSFKESVVNSLRGFIRSVGMKMVLEAFLDSLPGALDAEREPIRFEDLVGLKESFASGRDAHVVPTSVQQNVPAWTMFAMFFVVIPLSGSLISETVEGTMNRLRTMPVSYLSVMLGKIIVYVAVCMSQFGLMLLIGVYLLPRFGLPALELSFGHLPAAVVAMASALAATGFGSMFGTIFRTQDQAATFGAVTVVIAAAIGGVMVPVFVMPDFMQKLSIVSPLGWGLDAFLDILVRGGSMGSVLKELALLAGFFVATIGVSMLVFRRRYNI